MSALPATLPDGCTRKLTLHMKLADGGAATYSTHLPSGGKLPIHYQYDTQKKPDMETGYFIEGVERCFKSWKEVRDYWPEFVASKGVQP